MKTKEHLLDTKGDISLRDTIAIAAMQELVQNNVKIKSLSVGCEITGVVYTARAAYQIADAMIKEREKQQS